MLHQYVFFQVSMSTAGVLIDLFSFTHFSITSISHFVRFNSHIEYCFLFYLRYHNCYPKFFGIFSQSQRSNNNYNGNSINFQRNFLNKNFFNWKNFFLLKNRFSFLSNLQNGKWKQLTCLILFFGLMLWGLLEVFF